VLTHAINYFNRALMC